MKLATTDCILTSEDFFYWRLQIVLFCIICLCFFNTQIALSQPNDQLERLVNRYKEAKEQNRDEKAKECAWECYKLLRRYYPNKEKDRKVYLDELLNGFSTECDIFNSSIYLPNYSFVDSCLLETHVNTDILLKLTAYRILKKNYEENFEDFLDISKRSNNLNSKVFIKTLKLCAKYKKCIYKYGNDILKSFQSKHVDDIAFLIVYNAFMYEATDEKEQLKYTQLSIPKLKRIIDKKSDESVWAGLKAHDFIRDYLYSLRKVYYSFSSKNFEEKTSALSILLEAIKYVECIDSKDDSDILSYGKILYDLKGEYYVQCTKLKEKSKNENEDILAQRGLSVAVRSVKLSKDHHTAIEEVRYVSHTSQT